MDRNDAKLLPLATYGIAKGIMEVYVAPTLQEVNQKLRPSEKAWLILLGSVALYDCLSVEHETLSERYTEFVDDHPVMAWGAVAITAGHLLNIIPEKYDPIHNLAKIAGAI